MEYNNPNLEQQSLKQQPIVSSPPISVAAKSLRERVIRDIVIIVAPILALLVAVGIYFMIGAVTAIMAVPSVCSDNNHKAQIDTDKLKNSLSKITIGEVSPTRTYGEGHNDCILGEGSASAKADFIISSPNVATANDLVMASLHTPENPNIPVAIFFASSYANDRSHISIVSTRLYDASGENYTVDYWLSTPIACADSGTPKCRFDDASLKTYDYTHRPINKVTLSIAI